MTVNPVLPLTSTSVSSVGFTGRQEKPKKRPIVHLTIFKRTFLPSGTTIGSATTNTASVISTAPVITTAASSPSLSPSPTAAQTSSSEHTLAQETVMAVSQAPSSLAHTLGTGQVMVAAPSLSAALQGAPRCPPAPASLPWLQPLASILGSCVLTVHSW